MSKWIACADQLPEVTGVYPACSMDPCRSFNAKDWIDLLYKFDADAKRGESKWQHSTGLYDGLITHWMPLPSAPDED